MKLKLVEKSSNGKAHEFLVAIREELKGIRKILE
jgi:hypothetical protein